MKLILDCLLQGNDGLSRQKFCEVVVSYLSGETKGQLTLNIVDSLKEFYGLVSSDKCRTNVVARKIILQAVAGSHIRDNSQLSQTAEAIGARLKSLYTESENRKRLEENVKLQPFVEMLKRKSPQGNRYVSESMELDVIGFYENDKVSDIMKGHNNIFKETVISDTGVKTYFQRSKRVLKIPLCDLLKEAQKIIGFQFSVVTLMKLRPPWVYLSRKAHTLSCLCDRCQNVTLLLRCVCNFTN